ncbi:uncharacterized protein AKAW2_50385S [Aspergillus luchuensis]|uniref:Uncharacterized protein n=1 Tax=Aspergillus kawachii TaxID=1069201 RepID=A0A7R7WCM8_ASPKA|nr:uncharacterized protein AKAW2_50385S [Aspergillus luchuensis]BCS00044.1 hypothetical protein AKAW2_50385S [Aspergillus luchuensis]
MAHASEGERKARARSGNSLADIYPKTPPNSPRMAVSKAVPIEQISILEKLNTTCANTIIDSRCYDSDVHNLIEYYIWNFHPEVLDVKASGGKAPFCPGHL